MRPGMRAHRAQGRNGGGCLVSRFQRLIPQPVPIFFRATTASANCAPRCNLNTPRWSRCPPSSGTSNTSSPSRGGKSVSSGCYKATFEALQTFLTLSLFSGSNAGLSDRTLQFATAPLLPLAHVLRGALPTSGSGQPRHRSKSPNIRLIIRRFKQPLLR